MFGCASDYPGDRHHATISCVLCLPSFWSAVGVAAMIMIGRSPAAPILGRASDAEITVYREFPGMTGLRPPPNRWQPSRPPSARCPRSNRSLSKPACDVRGIPARHNRQGVGQRHPRRRLRRFLPRPSETGCGRDRGHPSHRIPRWSGRGSPTRPARHLFSRYKAAAILPVRTISRNSSAGSTGPARTCAAMPPRSCSCEWRPRCRDLQSGIPDRLLAGSRTRLE
jgi:hypothetical protein